jgi:2-polyprenyl-3-methyl-5-hydroxy-6-metoxy-1,4-benzoquinol methylase
MSCVLCGANDFKFIFRPPEVGEHALERCNACSLLQMKPMPTDAELAAYYQKYDVMGEREPYYRDLWGPDALQSGEGRAIADRTKWLRSIVAQPKKVLDIGSGPGLFLRLMKEAGASVMGVELNARAAERSAQEFGVPVHAGRIAELRETGFDVITLWDLVEHVNDPHALIHDCAARLAPGGWLFIETPNEGSLLDVAVRTAVNLGVTGPADTFYGMHHIALFRPKTIRRLLETHGFKVMQIRGAETDPARIFRGTGFKDRVMCAGLGVLFFIARIVGKPNKMLIAAHRL